MGRDKKKPSAPLGGSLAEDSARAMSSALKRTEGIDSFVERLYVGERNDQPTEWWRVFVPAKHLARCETWRRAYEAGIMFATVDGYRARNGGTFIDAADRLGYGAEVLAHDARVAECCGCGRFRVPATEPRPGEDLLPSCAECVREGALGRVWDRDRLGYVDVGSGHHYTEVSS